MGSVYVNANHVDDKVGSVTRAVSETRYGWANYSAVLDNSYQLDKGAFARSCSSRSLRNQIYNANELTGKAERLMQVLNSAGDMYKTCENNLKNSFDSFDSKTVSIENRIREALGMDPIITNKEQTFSNVAKTFVGVAVVGVTIGVALLTGPVGWGVVAGTVVSGTIGAVTDGMKSAANGGSFWDGASSGFMKGTINGAIESGCAAIGLGPVSSFCVKTIGQTGSSMLDEAMSGKNITTKKVFDEALVNASDQLLDIGGKALYDSKVDQVVFTIVGKATLENELGRDVSNSDMLIDGVNKYISDDLNDVARDSAAQIAEKSLEKQLKDSSGIIINNILKKAI